MSDSESEKSDFFQMFIISFTKLFRFRFFRFFQILSDFSVFFSFSEFLRFFRFCSDLILILSR